MNMRDLQAFVAVVESHSMAEAAEKLHLTQPGLTRRVQALEALLNVELLDRGAKPLKPTSIGREVYALAQTALRSVDDILTVTSPNAEPRGEFRLGVPPFLSELVLEDPLDRLRGHYPALTFRVTSAWSPHLLQAVERGAMDAAIVLFPFGFTLPKTMNASLVASQPITVVAAKSLDLGDGAKGLADLADHGWVLSHDGCGMRLGLNRALGAAGLPFNLAIEAFGSELQLSLVARGLGIGLSTQDALRRSAYRDTLQEIEVTDFHSRVEVWFLHGTLPGRLVRPSAMLLDSLTGTLGAAGLDMHL